MIEIMLPSIHNIRDLGDTITAEGKTVKRNRLLRSAHLLNATKEDLEYLKEEHHLDTVLDLRSSAEIKERPDRIQDLNFLHIPVFEEYRRAISVERILAHDLPDMKKFMTETYIDLLTCPEYVEGIARAVKAVMDHAEKEKGAILYHCSEGKDRTGIVTAILLKMLGAADETIMEDYLATNKYAVLVAHAESIQIKAMYDEVIAEYMYEASIVDERYMSAALKIINDGFIKEKLNIGDEEIAAFRNSILAD